MVSYEGFLIQLGYIGIFLLMTGTGFLGLFPPSKLVYIVAGILVATKNFNLTLVILFGALGHTLGNLFQYELARRRGIAILHKFEYLSPEHISNFQKTFEKNQYWYMFFGKVVDPVKVFISLCAGISKMNRAIFLSFAFIGSLIWATSFTLLGYFVGDSYETYGPLVGIVILIGGALVMTIFYKSLKKVSIEN